MHLKQSLSRVNDGILVVLDASCNRQYDQHLRLVSKSKSFVERNFKEKEKGDHGYSKKDLHCLVNSSPKKKACFALPCLNTRPGTHRY